MFFVGCCGFLVDFFVVYCVLVDVYCVGDFEFVFFGDFLGFGDVDVYWVVWCLVFYCVVYVEFFFVLFYVCFVRFYYFWNFVWFVVGFEGLFEVLVLFVVEEGVLCVEVFVVECEYIGIVDFEVVVYWVVVFEVDLLLFFEVGICG